MSARFFADLRGGAAVRRARFAAVAAFCLVFLAGGRGRAQSVDFSFFGEGFG